MKIKSSLLITIIIILVMATNCSRSQSPFSPDAVSNKAILNGTVVLSGTSTTSFGVIQVGVKGTSLYTNPDGNGNFRIDNLPLGDIVVEVSVKSDVSDIQIDNVKSGEEIRITVEVRSNNQAVFANMERNNESTEQLQVQIQPKKWNLNWVDSEDEVSAKISGDGYDTIHTDSVEIFGPDGIIKIKNTKLVFEIGGTYFEAKFSQQDAIALIDSPLTGMEYDITVKGTYGDENVSLDLTDTIEIVGKVPRDSEKLSIQVNPTKWNTNWEKSSGTVMVKFWGERYDQIDPVTVRMVGPDDEDGPDDVDVINSDSWNLTADHLIVKFSKKEVLSIIPDPTPGDKRIIRITNDPNGPGTFSFEYAIKIVGSKK